LCRFVTKNAALTQPRRALAVEFLGLQVRRHKAAAKSIEDKPVPLVAISFHEKPSIHHGDRTLVGGFERELDLAKLKNFRVEFHRLDECGRIRVHEYAVKARATQADHHHFFRVGFKERRREERARIGHDEPQRIVKIDRRLEILTSPGPGAQLHDRAAFLDSEVIVERVVILDVVGHFGRRQSCGCEQSQRTDKAEDFHAGVEVGTLRKRRMRQVRFTSATPSQR